MGSNSSNLMSSVEHKCSSVTPTMPVTIFVVPTASVLPKQTTILREEHFVFPIPVSSVALTLFPVGGRAVYTLNTTR